MFFLLAPIATFAAKTVVTTLATTAATVVVTKAASDTYDAIVHPPKEQKE